MSDEEIRKAAHDVAIIYLEKVDLDHKSAKQVANYYVQAKKDIEKFYEKKISSTLPAWRRRFDSGSGNNLKMK